MCDYSLMAFPNRLAVVGELLVVHRFETNSLGLISPSNASSAAESHKSHPASLWEAIKAYFKRETTNPVVAVCIPPASKLVLHDIPANLRDQLKVGSVEEVTFTQLSADAYTHRDAVLFANGRQLPLQHLIVGQRVKVLSVSSEEVQGLPEVPVPDSHIVAA